MLNNVRTKRKKSPKKIFKKNKKNNKELTLCQDWVIISSRGSGQPAIRGGAGQSKELTLCQDWVIISSRGSGQPAISGGRWSEWIAHRTRKSFPPISAQNATHIFQI
jgi:hypothetical protein